MSTLPARVELVEMGPRDGLQNETAIVAVPDKIAFIQALARSGLRRIELGSFVAPARVPQMADTEAVLAGLDLAPTVTGSVLVPNLHGMERAIACGVRHVAVFASASESFSQANIHCSIAESLERFAPVLAAARSHGIAVRGYVSCALGCPFEGFVAPRAVAMLAARLHAMGCIEISLGDTIGVGTPDQARTMVRLVAEQIPIAQLAIHFHDTYGQALANVFACLELGVAVIDSAVAGLGGCPYAPGATGNVASEDVVYMLHGLGIRTGIDLEKLCSAGDLINATLHRSTGSRAARALAARPLTARLSTARRP